MPTPIERFARARIIADRYMAAHQAVPQEVANELQTLMSRAAATLTPEQQQAAMVYVSQEQERILGEERAQLDQRSAVQALVHDARVKSQGNLAMALRNAGARQISRTAGLGRDGRELNEAQLAEAINGGKYTQPGRTHALDRAAQRVADQSGEPTSRADVQIILKQFGAMMDDSKLMDRYLTQECGDDQVQRAALESSIRETYLRETLQRRHDDELRKSDPSAFRAIKVEMNDTERRRLDVADRVLAHEGPEFFVDRISDESLNDPGSRGDTARAFAAHDDDTDPEVGEAVTDYNGVEQVAADHGVE